MIWMNYKSKESLGIAFQSLNLENEQEYINVDASIEKTSIIMKTQQQRSTSIINKNTRRIYIWVHETRIPQKLFR